MDNNKTVILNTQKNILSILVNSPIKAENILLEIGENDFTYLNFRIFFNVVKDLISNRKKLDITTVCDALLKENNLEKIGGEEFVVEIFEFYTTDANTEEYIEILFKNTTKIALQEFVSDIGQKINKNMDIDEIVSLAEKDVLDIRKARNSVVFKTADKEVQTVIQKIEVLQNSEENLTGITSGFHDLDNMTSGFQKGDLIILAARPSMGKTALALNFAVNAAKVSKKVVAFFSLEMPSEQLFQRMLGTESTVESTKIRTGKQLTKSDWSKITKAGDSLSKAKIYVDDTSGLKILDLQSKLRKLSREHDLGLVVIDYLQLISSGVNTGWSREQEVSAISRQLKAVARETNVPIICLSQLSRAVEKREDKRPIMSDLRDSGAIEQDADIIMFLYRNTYYEKNNDEAGEDYQPNNFKSTELADLIVSKHRNGPTGDLKLVFIKEFGSFANSK